MSSRHKEKIYIAKYYYISRTQLAHLIIIIIIILNKNIKNTTFSVIHTH